MAKEDDVGATKSGKKTKNLVISLRRTSDRPNFGLSPSQ